MRRAGARCLVPPCRGDTWDYPLPRENKGRRGRGEIQLPDQLKMAGGVSEATCAAYHLSGLMVVVYSRRFRRAQVPLESAGDFVTVGCKPVKGASVGNIIFTKIGIGCAWARRKFRCPGECPQLVRVSEVDYVYWRLALRPGLRLDVPRDSAIERHHIAGCCRSRCRDKHCRKTGEQQRDEKSCCRVELNVSIFQNLFSFSCFGFVVFVLGFGKRRPFPISSRKFAPRCKESLEPMPRIAPAAVMRSAWSVTNESLPRTVLWVLLLRRDAARQNRNFVGLFARHASHLGDARCDANTIRTTS